MCCFSLRNVLPALYICQSSRPCTAHLTWTRMETPANIKNKPLICFTQHLEVNDTPSTSMILPATRTVFRARSSLQGSKGVVAGAPVRTICMKIHASSSGTRDRTPRTSATGKSKTTFVLQTLEIISIHRHVSEELRLVQRAGECAPLICSHRAVEVEKWSICN